MTNFLTNFLFVLFVVCFTCSCAQSTDWKLDTVIRDTILPGKYGKTFKISLPFDETTGKINFGVLRVNVNQTATYGQGKLMLYLSTSSSHAEAGVGPAWPVPRYAWALSSSGTVRITRCETDPMNNAQFAAKNKQTVPENLQHSAGVTAELGYLVEETMYTTAFCLPKYTSTIGSTPLSQRVGTSAVAKDAPNSNCQCLGEAQTTKFVYARARCYGKTSGCTFAAAVSVTCPLGTSPGADGKCSVCEVDANLQNAASVVTTPIGSGSTNTIASAQCLSDKTCPAGTYLVEEDVVRDALDNFYVSKSIGGSGRRLNSDIARVGRCEQCKKPYFSVSNSTNCDYKVGGCLIQKPVNPAPLPQFDGEICGCPVGTYADWSSQACVACSEGRWSNTKGATDVKTCQPCGRGKFTPFKGATNRNMCIGCQQDTYNDEPAASECKFCPEGKLTLAPLVKQHPNGEADTESSENNGTSVITTTNQANTLMKRPIVAPNGMKFTKAECERACRTQAPCVATDTDTNKCCKSFKIIDKVPTADDDGIDRACGITPCPEDGICEENANRNPGCLSCINSKYFFEGDCYKACPPGYTGMDSLGFAGIGQNETGRTCVPAHNATTINDVRGGCKKLCEIGEHYVERDGGAGTCIKCIGGADWCVGTTDCLGNRTEAGCIKCINKFYEVRDVCTPCPEDSVRSMIVLLIVLVLVLGIVFIFAGSSRPETSLSGVMIFLGHIQIQGYLLRFPVNWPPEFVAFMKLLSSLCTLDLPALVPAPECALNWNTEQKYFTQMATMPLLLSLCWFPVLLAMLYSPFCECKGFACCRERIRGHKFSTTERSSMHKATAVSTMILSIMYGFISPASTELGLCSKQIGDESLSPLYYLNSDPSIQCVWYHYCVATLFGLLYSLGIPLFLVGFLYWGKNKELLFDEEHWIPDHVGWIYLRFEHSVFWWELVNMLQKTVIGVTERVGAGGGEGAKIAQLVVTFFVLTVSLLMQIYFKPYASMLARSDIVHEPYSFTIRGGKRLHGVHFEVQPSEYSAGLVVHSVDEDAKYAPVCDDEFQSHEGNKVSAHSMRMGDILTHIDGKLLPHVFARQKKRSLARAFTSMLHITHDASNSIEGQVCL